MNLTDLSKRVEELVKMGEDVLATSRSTGGRFSMTYVDQAPMAGFRSATLSFIERVYGRDHPHFHQFTKRTENAQLADAEQGMAILQAVRSEIAGGWLSSIKALANAEVFADFIEMAEHLLDSGYKDPAAVMAGSVLEEHLRQLCRARGMSIEGERDGRTVPLKADRLNAELAKVEAYTKLDQKLVTAWLDLRNNAAHGKYDEYTTEQVAQMLAGVVDFMARRTA